MAEMVLKQPKAIFSFDEAVKQFGQGLASIKEHFAAAAQGRAEAREERKNRSTVPKNFTANFV